MLNKKIKVLMAGMITAVTLIGGNCINTYAYSSKDVSSKGAAYIQEMDMSKAPDITKRFKEMNFLSNSEKQRLVEEQKATKPHYNKISSLGNQMEKISNQIMKGAEKILKEYDEIVYPKMTLWFKVDAEVIETVDGKLPSNEARVIASKELTSREKESLLKDAKRLDEIDVEIQKYYDKVDKATAHLSKQIDKEYEKIEAIHKKNSQIWSKIHRNMDGK